MINAMKDSWDAYARVIYTRSQVSSITFSHKDDLIAVGGRRSVEIFEAVTGQRRATMACKGAECVTFSPDDTLLVNGCADGTIGLWDLQTGGLVTTLSGHVKPIKSVEFSPCGIMIASTASDHTIRIWNVLSHIRQFVFQTHLEEEILSVCWTATGRQVISGSQNGSIRVWDISENKPRCLKTFHTTQSHLHVFACSPDASFAASGFHFNDANSAAYCNGVQHIGTHTGDVISESSTGSFGALIRFLNGKVLYTDRSTLVIQDLTQIATKSKFNLKFGYGCVFAISSDGACTAASNRYSTQTQIVKIRQTDGMNQILDEAHRDGDSAPVTSVNISGDGRFIASLSDVSREAKLWDANTGLCLNTFSDHYGLVIIFSPDSTLLASETDVRDVRTGRLVSTLHHSLVWCEMEFSPNGSQLAVIGEKDEDDSTHLELLDVETGNCLASMPVDNSLFYGIPHIFGPDGTSVILKGLDSMKAWRIAPASLSNCIDESSNDSDYQFSDDDSFTDDLPMVFVPIHDGQPSFPQYVRTQEAYAVLCRSLTVKESQRSVMTWS
jgi:WD40 repeat protein